MNGTDDASPKKISPVFALDFSRSLQLKPSFCSGLLSEFAAHVVSFYILQEIEHLTHLEQYTLSSDLSQGYALKMLAGK